MKNIFLVVAMSAVIGGAAGYFGGQFSNNFLEAGQIKETQAEAVSPAFNGPPVKYDDAQQRGPFSQFLEQLNEDEKQRVAAEKQRALKHRVDCLEAKTERQTYHPPEGRDLIPQVFVYAC